MRKGALVAVAVFAAVLFFAASTNLFVAKALQSVDVPGAVANHHFAYGQKEIVDLFHASVENDLQPDFAPLESWQPALNLEEGVEGPQEGVFNEAQTEWLAGQLEGKTLLDATMDESGCASFVALDTEAQQLVVITVNTTAAPYGATLQVEQLNGDMTGAVQHYTIAPIIEEVPLEEDAPEETGEGAPEGGEEETQPEAPQDRPLPVETLNAPLGRLFENEPAPGTPAPQAAPEENTPPAAGEPTPGGEPETTPAQDDTDAPPAGDTPTTDEGTPPAEDDGNVNPEAPVEEPTPEGEGEGEEELPEEEVDEPEEEEPEAETRLEVTGFAFEEGEATAYDSTAQGLSALVQPGTASVISINTGMLYGGQLGKEPPRFQLFDSAGNISSLSLQTGPAGPRGASPTGNHGLLRLYGKDDLLAGGSPNPGATGAYATYSLDGHMAYYDVDATSSLNITHVGTGNAARTTFRVELHNSPTAEIDLKTINGTGMGITGSNGNVLIVEAKTTGAVLNVNNNGVAIDTPNRTEFYGEGTINADSSDNLAIMRSSGAASTMIASEKIKINASGAKGGIHMNTDLAAKLGAEVVADAKDNENAIAILAKNELYVQSLALVKGHSAGTGVQATHIVTNQKEAAAGTAINDKYSTAADVDNPNRSRLVGIGSKTGIYNESSNTALQGWIYLGQGTLVYAEGGEIGMRGHCFEYTGNTSANSNVGRPAYANGDSGHTIFKWNGMPYKQYGTLIARGTGAGSTGMLLETSAAADHIEISFGSRIIAVGDKNGLHVYRRGGFVHDFWVTKLSELYAYGATNAGILWDGVSSGSNGASVIFENLGKVYARGGKYGGFQNSASVSSIINVNGRGSLNSPFPGKENDYSATGGTGATYTAIGGIGSADDPIHGMPEDTPLSDPQTWLTEEFDYANMPKPLLDEHGVVPEFKQGTYGHFLRDGGYIATYHRTSQFLAYGGHVGISNVDADLSNNFTQPTGLSGHYVVSYSGSIMSGHGGMFGVVSNSYIHCWGRGYGPFDPTYANIDGKGGNLSVPSSLLLTTGNSVLKGYGKSIGVMALGYSGAGYVTTVGETYNHVLGRNYIYGYGEKWGIKAKAEVSSAANSVVIGETWVDSKARPGEDFYEPAVVAGTRFEMLNAGGADGFVHELYNVQNYRIRTLPPYQLNAEVPALAQRLGTDPKVLLRMDWTTPVGAPNKDPSIFSRDWLDYDPNNDQKLVKPGTVDGVTGLIAFGNTTNATLVGQSTGTATQMTAGIPSATGKITGAGKYRITLRGVNMTNVSTMNLQFDLYENFLDDISHMGEDITPTNIKVPTETIYDLKFENNDPATGDPIESPRDVQLKGVDSYFDVGKGEIYLTKLRLGQYTMTPNVDIGRGYGTYPTLRFDLKIDTNDYVPPPRPADGFYPNYAEYWHEKVFLIDEDADGDTIPSTTWDEKNNANKANVTIKSLLNDDGKAYATVTTHGSTIVGDGGKGTPTIPTADYDPPVNPEFDPKYPEAIDPETGEKFPEFLDPETYYDVEAFKLGKVNLYYFPLPVQLDFQNQDVDSKLPLAGTFEVKAFKGTKNITAKIDSISSGTLTNGGTAAAPTWPELEVYAGVRYEFKQTAVGTQPYLRVNGTYAVELTMNGDTGDYLTEVKETGLSAVEKTYFESGSDETEDVPPEKYFYVRAFNDLPTTQTAMHLVDHDKFGELDTQTALEANLSEILIPGVTYKLYVQYATGGPLVDVTSEFLTADAAGNYTLTLKPNRVKYVLEQTNTNDSYYQRENNAEFKVDDASVTYTSPYVGQGALSVYELEYLPPTAPSPPLPDHWPDNGWMEPTGWNKTSVWLTNRIAMKPFAFTKLDKAGAPINGATFTLYAVKDGMTPGAGDDLALPGTCWDLENPVAQITSANNGTTDGFVDFDMIKVGSYTLVESWAPSGYALPHGHWRIEVAGSGITITAKTNGGELPPAFLAETDEDGVVHYSVHNYRMQDLPLSGTGGIWPTTALGLSVLALLLLAFWLERRKKTKKLAALAENDSFPLSEDAQHIHRHHTH